MQNNHFENNINTKNCIACIGLIHKDAKICQFCRSSQYTSPLSVTIKTIKWIGGITALLSLVLAVSQLNNLFEGWRNKRELVNELIAAAELQQESMDYKQALNLLEEATQLEPTSKNARHAKIRIAMRLIRTKGHFRRGPFHEDTVEVINKLLPIIARGAASSDKLVAADANAHIGWAYTLLTKAKRKNEFSIDNYFERALQLDKNNVYAHCFWGYWILSGYNEQKYSVSHARKAIEHFNKAVKSEREFKFARNLQISELSRSRDEEALLEVFNIMIHAKERNEKLKPDCRYTLIKLFDHFSLDDQKVSGDLAKSVLENFEIEKLLEVFKWLYADTKDINNPGNVHYERYNYTIACLTAAAGEKEKALKIFKLLKSKLRDLSVYRDDIDLKINENS
jgi:hypothetical protein